VAGPGNARATVSWGAAPSNGATVTSYLVTASPGGGALRTAGARSCVVTGLLNGTAYTFSVTATNSVGTGQPSTPSAPVTPDGTRPTVSLTALPVFSLGSPLTVRWTGGDTGSGIKGYTLTYRRTRFDGYAVNGGFPATTASSISFTPARGETYDFTLVASDKAGNTTTVKGFTAVPLDDRSLTPSSGWTRTTASAYYAGTATTVARSLVTLTRTSVKAKRLSLVASRTPGGGVVGVYLNGVLLKQISLASTTTAHRQVYTVFSGTTLRSGNLVIKTLNAGRATIDGVAISAL
jgi:hypothetical protein